MENLGIIGTIGIFSIVGLTLGAFGLKAFADVKRLRQQVDRLKDEVRQLKKEQFTPESPRPNFRVEEKAAPPARPATWRLSDED